MRRTQVILWNFERGNEKNDTSDGGRGLSGESEKIPDSGDSRRHSSLVTYGSARLEPVNTGNRCLNIFGNIPEKSKGEREAVKTIKWKIPGA
ncbi:hypothetical protein MSMTP_1234 [Methanosarcina sp. MTP4]|uniref:hypothetical protein n=1 Tax=Methanosarcina sp. MTP4 TaxID=1434100 RepID=UPI00061549B8|nr:hypothetical protein [Methanosarcina sp. MTP4]AKB24703.1 hypothetical protein MSMTP_1234 [Methanosarcina sp. MTP4]